MLREAPELDPNITLAAYPQPNIATSHTVWPSFLELPSVRASVQYLGMTMGPKGLEPVTTVLSPRIPHSFLFKEKLRGSVRALCDGIAAKRSIQGSSFNLPVSGSKPRSNYKPTNIVRFVRFLSRGIVRKTG